MSDHKTIVYFESCMCSKIYVSTFHFFIFVDIIGVDLSSKLSR